MKVTNAAGTATAPSRTREGRRLGLWVVASTRLTISNSPTNREDDQPRPAVEGGVLGILRLCRGPATPAVDSGVREPGRSRG